MSRYVEARDILKRCIGTHGVYADPTRYNCQCWTRDFSLAVQPTLRCVPGGMAAAEQHLRSLALLQRADGKIPILFLDGLRGHAEFLKAKVCKSLRDRKLSFMLRRYLEGQLHDLTPGTRDSELHFINAVLEHEACGGSPQLRRDLMPAVRRAFSYIVRNLLDEKGLLRGADWRDTMHAELADKALLSNNAILYKILKRLGAGSEARCVQQSLIGRRTSNNNNTLVDYEGSSRFDPLGGALAVLCGVAEYDFAQILEGFRSVDTPRGVAIQCRHNPTSREEAEVIERTDGVVVWPFVVRFAVLALIRIAETANDAEVSVAAVEMAREQILKIDGMPGFHEWYDPATGRGYGAQEQLWSATLYMRVCQAIERFP